MDVGTSRPSGWGLRETHSDGARSHATDEDVELDVSGERFRDAPLRLASDDALGEVVVAQSV